MPIVEARVDDPGRKVRRRVQERGTIPFRSQFEPFARGSETIGVKRDVNAGVSPGAYEPFHAIPQGIRGGLELRRLG